MNKKMSASGVVSMMGLLILGNTPVQGATNVSNDAIKSENNPQENAYVPPAKNHPVGVYDDNYLLPVVDSHRRGIERRIDLPAWLETARDTPVGSSFELWAKDREEIRALRALGFARTGLATFERKVDLMATHAMSYFSSQQLPNVDAIAIVSIFRPQTKEQYLHRTLRSMFAQLPNDTTVNVFVGDENEDYVSNEALRSLLGTQDAQRVNVISCPQSVAQYFDGGDFSTSARANWNFNRALRSYDGNSNMMVFEDDVEFAENAVANIAPWLTHMPSYVLYMFNRTCAQTADAWTHPRSVLSVSFQSVRRNLDYATLQASIFSSEITRSAGEYLAYRLDRESHDFLLARFLSGTTMGTSTFYPSPVQHIGYATTGLSAKEYLPISQCYQPALGLIDEAYAGGM